MNFYYLTLVFTILEIVTVYEGTDFLGMVGVLTGNQYNRFHIIQSVVAAILFQNGLAVFMKGKTITNLHFLNIILAVARHV